MTTISLSQTSTPTFREAGTVNTLVSSFNEFCEGVREGREIETRYRAFARMSGPDLAKLGMTRSDIYRASLTGRPV
jgi:hypothetical protein